MAKHPVVPDIGNGFWSRFDELWDEPLGHFEQTITLATSFGSDPNAPYFNSMDEEYWHVLRSLHSRTCLHARGVLALLTNGLVDPAWVQWRVCHEAATIALFIANDPQMANRYLRHHRINQHHLAKTLYEKNHHDAPSDEELDYLEMMAETAKSGHELDYGQGVKSRDYGWSGLSNFSQIEASTEANWRWKARPEYVFASARAHCAPSAVRPVRDDQGRSGFPVGPINFRLTGPADLTCLSLVRATIALIRNAIATTEIAIGLQQLDALSRSVGKLSWLSDPAIFCPDCGGHVPEASPPEEIPDSEKPEPCRCADFATV
ncbi:MAG: DUF5677 domain-containing protein [Chloroflexi bacterium]|nr:DUF5677 domain-containing protein [Chloroflexota bacterium]